MNELSSPTSAWKIISDIALVAATAVLAVFLLLGYTQTAYAAAPTDHSDYSDEEAIRYDGAVDYLIEQGVLSYDTNCDEADETKFCPGDEMPRWQTVVWIVRGHDAINNEAFDDSTPAEAVFADVDVDEWWAPYVNRAEELGITGGCGENDDDERIFCPDQTASRAQMATMLQRAFDVADATETDVFVDVETDDTHATAIDAIAEAGITKGCTREAQIVDSKVATGESREDATEFYEDNQDERFYCPYKSPRDQMACLLARAMRADDPLECSNPAPAECVPAGSKKCTGEEGGVPETGAENNIVLGSVFIGLLTLSIIYSRIYLDARRRQNAPNRLRGILNCSSGIRPLPGGFCLWVESESVCFSARRRL